MASISSVTPFLLICVSSSATASSNVKPYWKPEQPPPCTKTRSFSSGLPSSSTSSLTLAAALSVKTIGAGISVEGESSATAFMRILGRRKNCCGDPDLAGSTLVGGELQQRTLGLGGRHVLQLSVYG